MQGAAVDVDEATATQLQQKISAFLMAAKSLDSYFATLGASCGADFSAGVLREVRGDILRLPHPGEVVPALVQGLTLARFVLRRLRRSGCSKQRCSRKMHCSVLTLATW